MLRNITMKKIILLFYISILTTIIYGQTNTKDYWDNGKLKHEGQKIEDKLIGFHKYYYETGELKMDVKYDTTGLLYEMKEYDKFGNLLSIYNSKTFYKDYPLRDFSKIHWTKITDGVYIYKFNTIDTNIVISDSSSFTADYQCYFSNGQLLDNTFNKGCPYNSRLYYMMEGFQIGIKKMKPGETALIKIEPTMGFGNVVSGNVPANSTLIYLINLIRFD